MNFASVARFGVLALSIGLVAASCASTPAVTSSSSAAATSTVATSSSTAGSTSAAASDSAGQASAPATFAPASDQAASMAPVAFGYYTQADAAGLESFPVSAETVSELIEAYFPDQHPTEISCTNAIDLTAGSTSSPCHFTFDGKKMNAYAYAATSTIKGNGILIAHDKQFDDATAAALASPDTEVLTFAVGDMWGVDSAIPVEDVQAHVKAALGAYSLAADSVTCKNPIDIPAGANLVHCTVTAGAVSSDATVIGGFLANKQENGMVIIVPKAKS